jgi:hypothetical protein
MHDIFSLIRLEVENLSDVKKNCWWQSSRRYIEWDTFQNEILQGAQVLILFLKGSPLTNAVTLVKYEI